MKEAAALLSALGAGCLGVLVLIATGLALDVMASRATHTQSLVEEMALSITAK